MNRRTLYIFLGAIGILVVFVIYLVVTQGSSTTPKVQKTQQSSDNQTDSQGNLQTSNGDSQPSVEPTSSELTPREVTRRFYSWYFSYPKDPLSSRAYKSSPYLTDAFKQLITSQTEGNSPNNPGRDDPVFCNGNKTKNITVGPEVAVSSDRTDVTIQNAQDGRTIYRFALTNNSGQWLIDDIICVP